MEKLSPTGGEAQVGLAVERGLRLLAYHPRSEAELRFRLARHFAPDVAAEAVARLKAQGLVDDAAFAHFWREHRVGHKPRSAALVRRELIRKGVPSEVATQAVEGIDDQQGALAAARQYMHRLSLPDWPTFLNRVGMFLQRRGFSGSVIRQTLHQLWQEKLTGKEES